MNLRVLKFGGSSVAIAPRWASIKEIVQQHREEGCGVVVVCSALGGVTDKLERLVEGCRGDGDVSGVLDDIAEQHHALATELGVDDSIFEPELEGLVESAKTRAPMTPLREARMLASGELMSTQIGHAFLEREGISNAWLDARNVLRSPGSSKGPAAVLSAECDSALNPTAAAEVERAGVVITQGFIARNDEGQTVLLGRGGSDTSAAYLAAILGADRLEIWSDVPGVFTANPAHVPDARLVTRMGYAGASAVSALGAKVLHPRCLEVATEHDIPLRLGCTQHPHIEGTQVHADPPGPGICAATSRDSLVLFVLRRPYQWQPVGFLADIARCFHEQGLSIDLVSSCASEIRVTLDAKARPVSERRMQALIESLSEVCDVEIVEDVASVSVVGQRLSASLDRLGTVAECLDGADIHMVTYAGNDTSVSYVLDRAGRNMISQVHDALFPDDGAYANGKHAYLGATWSQLNASA